MLLKIAFGMDNTFIKTLTFLSFQIPYYQHDGGSGAFPNVRVDVHNVMPPSLDGAEVVPCIGVDLYVTHPCLDLHPMHHVDVYAVENDVWRCFQLSFA